MAATKQSTLPAALRYSGIQPQYFPRLHYFSRILNADIFMVRDDAQYVRKLKYPDGHNHPSYQAQTIIITDKGVQGLNVPVEHAGRQPIYQTKLSEDSAWHEKHLKTIYYAYAKAPYFGTLYPEIERIITKKYRSLAELNLATTLWAISKLLGAEASDTNNPTIKAAANLLQAQTDFRLKSIRLGSQSQFYKDHPTATANEKIIGLCQEVGATENYCGGTAAEAYLDANSFAQNDIKVIVQDWHCPDYPQQFAKRNGFAANLSIIDLLMNVATNEAQLVLKG